MKFLDFFAGIGGFRLGMEMAGHECVGHCEIDKYAERSYRAIHEVKDYEWFANDITRVEPRDLPEADCYCFGFPCQAFSIAGKRGGFEDTRGTLFFEVMRLVKERHPSILFAENVKGLLNHEGGRTFGTIINTMADLGYDVEWQVLNSKNYGVPQNRERVFIIGHFGRTGGRKVFPLGEDATKIDVVQGQVANTLTTRTEGDGVGTYVIEDKQPAQVRQLVGGHQGSRIYDSKGLSITLTSQGSSTGAKTGLYVVPENGVMIKETTAKGHTEAVEGDSINLSMPGSKTRRDRVGKDVANTLDTTCSQGALEGKRIRRLTPRECFRLQGFPDEAYEKAAEVNSDSQLYKQAGNSVTVNTIYEIAKRLEGENAHKTSKDDD